MATDDLEALLRSRVPIIVVDSRDESQVLKRLARACAQVRAPLPLPRAGTAGAVAMAIPPGASLTPAGLPLFQWTVTDGLKRLDIEVGPPQRTLAEPLDILKHLRATTLAGAYALLDFHPVPARADGRAAVEGHRPGLRPLCAHRGAHQLRDRDPARAGASDRVWCWRCPIAPNGER